VKAWKEAEKQVADIFCGIRRVRVSYAESCGDIIHPVFSIEVKQGKQIPRWIAEISKPVIINETFYLICVSEDLSFSHSLVSLIHAPKKTRKSIKFLIDGIAQASSYDQAKRPLLCMKPPRFRGIIVCGRLDDICS
jgi:hypothetical protein